MVTQRPPEQDDEAKADNVVKVDFARPSKVAMASSAQTMASESDLQKSKVFGDLLDQGMAMLVLNARHEGVDVPADFKTEPDLRLNFSRRFGIKDFVHSEQGVEATLSFAQGFYFCRIPWKAVFAIQSHVSKLGSLWPEDVPEELRIHMKPAPAAQKLVEVVDADATDEPPAQTSDDEVKPTGRPQLRLVKDPSP
jgi:stringent starvation protein B